MTSLLTNTSAMSALRVLAGTQKALAATETQISTGLRVAAASDNAAYWSIGTTMKSRAGAVRAVADGMALGSAIVDVAYTGITRTIDVLDRMKALTITSKTPGVDTTAIDSDLNQLGSSIKSIADSSSFNGVNLLESDIYKGHPEYASGPSTDIVTSVTGQTTNMDLDVSLFGTTNPSGVKLTGIMEGDQFYDTSKGLDMRTASAPNGSGYAIPGIQTSHIGNESLSDLQTMRDAEIHQVEVVTTVLKGYAATLGGIKTSLGIQPDFASSLSNALTSGIGSLVDADMNLASTRLQALQTQQRLGIQALSIANDNSKAVLKLFG